MTRQQGFTLIELLIVIIVFMTFSLSLTETVLSLGRENNLSHAYTEDVRGLRRASRILADEVREAGGIEDLDVRLSEDRLLVRGREIARNVAELVLERDGGFVRIKLTLGNRSGVPAGAPAGLHFRVRTRQPGGNR